jgi:hypothetical protein
MRGDHPRLTQARLGTQYALLIEVAGEEENGSDALSFRSNGRRDSTALTVVEIDAGSGSLPVYRVVDRLAWTGTKHTTLHAAIVKLAREVWKASAVVVDATGVGAGLASFLNASLSSRPPIRVIPFVFTQASKSKLGWDFVSLIDAGRFSDYRDDSSDGTPGARLTARWWSELQETTYETSPGPGKLLRWSVPDARGHDDLVMSAALTAVLDEIDWRPRHAVGHGSLLTEMQKERPE